MVFAVGGVVDVVLRSWGDGSPVCVVPLGSADGVRVHLDVLPSPVSVSTGVMVAAAVTAELTAPKVTWDFVKADVVYDGAMIALPVPARYAIDGPTALAAASLHITVLYLGDAADWDEKERAEVIKKMEKLVDGPFTINVSGWAVLGDDRALVVLVEAPELDDLHHMVVEAVPLEQTHPGYVAHFTLAYDPDEIDVGALDALVGDTFEVDRLMVWFGSTVSDNGKVTPGLGSAEVDLTAAGRVFANVQMHGTHDQRSHGRRGGGGGSAPGDDSPGAGSGAGRGGVSADYAAHLEGVKAVYNNTAAYEAARDRYDTTRTHRTRAGEWTPERQALHARILDEFEAAQTRVPRGGEVIVSGGLGGAGKTTVLKMEARRLGIEFDGDNTSSHATVNPDDFKTVLFNHGAIPAVPGFTPAEASTFVHVEAQHLATLATERMIKSRINTIYDFTMSSDRSIESRVKPFVDAGFEVKAVFVDVSIGHALDAGEQRHRRGFEKFVAGEDPMGGRFVPSQNYDEAVPSPGSGLRSGNRESFERWKAANPEIRSMVVDNDRYNTRVVEADRLAGWVVQMHGSHDQRSHGRGGGAPTGDKPSGAGDKPSGGKQPGTFALEGDVPEADRAEIEATLSGLVARYPIGHVRVRFRSGEEAITLYANAQSGDPAQGNQAIHVNAQEWVKQSGTREAEWKSYVVNANQAAGTITHEYGHLVDGHLGRTMSKAGKKEWDRITETSGSGDWSVLDVPSIYGGENRYEMAAELFSAHVHQRFDSGRSLDKPYGPKSVERLQAYETLIAKEFG